jgi:hypothetical protein
MLNTGIMVILNITFRQSCGSGTKDFVNTDPAGKKENMK